MAAFRIGDTGSSLGRSVFSQRVTKRQQNLKNTFSNCQIKGRHFMILGAVQLLRNALGGRPGVTLCDRGSGGRPSVT